MFKLAHPFFIHCITPMHAGSGNDLGIVDMPIQREKHTSFPKIEGSSLKGSIREAFEEKLISEDDKKKIHLAFGYDDSEKNNNVKKLFEDNKEFAGALGFTDARLLLFPVKSMKGVFAWITCPEVIERFIKDLKLCFKNNEFEINNLEVPDYYSTPKGFDLFIKDKKIILDEYTFEINYKEVDGGKCYKFVEFLNKIISVQNLDKKLVVLSKDDFKDFVNLSTEVITRTKINNETGTVQPGALFTEEYLPAETIMYSLVLSSPVFQSDDKKGIFKQNGKKEEELVMEFFEKGIPEVIQIGGNATLGKGLVEITTMKGGENGNQ